MNFDEACAVMCKEGLGPLGSQMTTRCGSSFIETSCPVVDADAS